MTGGHATRLALVCAALAAAASPASAQATTRMRFGDAEPTADLTPSQRAFATAYVRAITGQDPSRYTRLIHPASLACRNKDNAEIFADLYGRRQGLPAPSSPVTVESLPPAMQIFDFMATQGFVYPARPTHAFHLDMVLSETRQRSLSVFAVLLNGSWYEVHPCPTAEAVAKYRAKKTQDAADEAKARELATGLRDPLRAELLALLNDGQKVAAIRKYREAAGVDLAMAKRVIEALDPRPR